MESFEQLGKGLVFVGALVALLGIILIFSDKVPLVRSLGRLPGDIAYKKDNFQFYFPLATSIILSLILSLVAWLLRR